MRIVTGSGRNRETFELPCAHVVKAAPVKDQEAACKHVCGLLGIK